MSAHLIRCRFEIRFTCSISLRFWPSTSAVETVQRPSRINSLKRIELRIDRERLIEVITRSRFVSPREGDHSRVIDELRVARAESQGLFDGRLCFVRFARFQSGPRDCVRA